VAGITRRLAAVAFADVAGWSRLIEKNDVGTLRAWKALRNDVIEPRLREHGGRILEIAGDAAVVEFPSAVAAVNWALDVQRGIPRHVQGPQDDDITLTVRIGINVADVIVDGDKLVGDGVNVAARIHQLASPGEIVVTDAVREHVGGKLAVEFRDLGEHHLKNISRAVRLYRLEAEGLPFIEPNRAGDAERMVRALLVLDIPESARLMEDDEHEVVSRWRSLVDVVTSEVLPSRGGRVAKRLEGGLLMDFPAAQAAVTAAFAIQQACNRANAGVAADRQILPRMGVQVSEVIADEKDIYGRGVNLATQLTTIAGPGEIVVSAAVRDELTPNLDADVEDLGECYLKQLRHPVRAYRLGPPGPRPVIEPGGAAGELRPTIAIIPFKARGGGHEVLGEVLADEVISVLSRSSDLSVISRLSTTAFRDREATIGEMSAHLNASYVLSGAYRISHGQVALAAELAEARSGRVVWAKELKGRVAAILEGNGELIEGIVGEVSAAVTARELERTQSLSPPTLENYTLLIGAISLMHRLSAHDFHRARQMLEVLTSRAPRLAIPQAWLAKWHVLRVQQGWSSDPKADAQAALECTKRALDTDSHCSLALAIDGFVHTNLLKSLDVAQERYELALDVNPSDSLAWLLKGMLHAFKGEGKAAMRDTQRALRLSPLDPHRYFYDSLAASAALSAGQHERAIELARRSLRANRTHTSTYRVLVISQWQSGRHEEARRNAKELMRLEPTLSVGKWLERSPSSGYEIGRICARAMKEAGVPQ
jgi:adenylate cyclase